LHQPCLASARQSKNCKRYRWLESHSRLDDPRVNRSSATHFSADPLAYDQVREWFDVRQEEYNDPNQTG